VGADTPTGVGEERERGGRRAGRHQLLADPVSEYQQVSKYTLQKGSGDIASGAKRNSHEVPYGLSLQLDSVAQRMPLLGKVPGRAGASCPAVL
jgi:hypothetical protein